MRESGLYQYPRMDRVIYGKPAAQAVLEEAAPHTLQHRDLKDLNPKRVFQAAAKS